MAGSQSPSAFLRGPGVTLVSGRLESGAATLVHVAVAPVIEMRCSDTPPKAAPVSQAMNAPPPPSAIADRSAIGVTAGATTTPPAGHAGSGAPSSSRCSAWSDVWSAY